MRHGNPALDNLPSSVPDFRLPVLDLPKFHAPSAADLKASSIRHAVANISLEKMTHAVRGGYQDRSS